MSHQLSIIASFAILSVAFQGCGGQDVDGSTIGNENSNGSTEGNAKSICAADCGQSARCDATAPESECRSKCEADSALAASMVKPEFASEMVKCYQALSCETHDDVCLLNSIAAVAPNWQTDSLRAACNKKVKEECGGRSEAVACLIAPALTATGRNRLQDCLAQPCDGLGSCMSSQVGFGD
jgi:hypothetical protein